MAWAGWWLFFGIASGLGEKLSPAGVVMHALVPGGLALAGAIVGWRWPGIGGGLLILDGVLAMFALATGVLNPRQTGVLIFLLLTLVAPPIIA